MSQPTPLVIAGAVEGMVDEAVLRRLVWHVRGSVKAVYGKNGKTHLRKQLAGYNQAARFSPWLVLVDLDREADCAPLFRAAWLPKPASLMCFRVAVREIEAWLLADRERIATFLGVAVSRVPPDPEAEPDPKRTVVDLARRARRREIREDMAPRPGSGRTVGPAYTSRLIEFASHATAGWRSEIAAKRADSLRRCLMRLRGLTEGK